MKKLIYAFVLLVTTVQLSFAQTPFWSEDFAGGLPATWTTVDLNISDTTAIVFEYCNNPSLGAPCGTISTMFSTPFASTTANNGFLLVDSDAGVSSPPALASDTRLTTSAIDLSSQPTVYVRFQSRVRTFDEPAADNLFFRVSTDGVNWTDYQIFPELTAANAQSVNPKISIFNISSIAGSQPTVYFQWRWTHNWQYAFLLDDIELFSTNPLPANDLGIVSAFYPFSNYQTSLPHMPCDTFGFGARVGNFGGAPQNATIVVDILNASNAVVYTQSKSIGALPVDSTDVAISFDNTWAPNLPVGTYTIRYTLSSTAGADALPFDNVKSRTFEVTDSTWAKSPGATTYFRPSNIGDSWAMVNVYRTCNTGDDIYVLRDITFAAASNSSVGGLDGKKANIFVCKEDPDATFNVNELFGGGALQILGEGQVPLSGGVNASGEFTGTVSDLATGQIGVPLENDATYWVIVQFADESKQVFGGWNEVYDYDFLSTLIFNNQYFSGFAGTDGGYFTRLTVSKLLVSTSETELHDALQVMPNPARDVVSLEINLDHATQAEIRIYDIFGQVVVKRTLDNVSRHTETFDISALPVGNYVAFVTTDKGYARRHFTVIR